jgi:hypothetical protein
MTKVIGEVGWDTVGEKTGKSEGKDTWMRLEDGSNLCRIATNPFQYVVHKGVRKVGDKGFGEKVMCSIEDCVLCKSGHNSSVRWYIGILDRKSTSFKILDAGGSIVFDLKTLNKGRWGDVRKYDIEIIKDKNADPQHYYKVLPVERTPLSAADQKLIDEADLEYIKRKTIAPTPEQVKERVEKILGGSPLFIPPAQQRKEKDTSKKVASVAKEVDTTETDNDDLFPSYTGT